MQFDRRGFLFGAASVALTGCDGAFDLPGYMSSVGSAGGRGPESPSLPGAVEELSDKIDGLDRLALLYVPSSYDASKPAPLVVGTHGNGGSGRTVYKRYAWGAECERRGWIGVFPDSDIPGRHEAVDNDFINALLDRVSGEYAVDAGRVFGTGFSGGCFRQYAFAVKNSKRVAAIGVVGGAISHGDRPELEDPERNRTVPLSVLHLHGERDTSIPLRGGSWTSDRGDPRTVLPVKQALAPWIRQVGADPETPDRTARLPSGCPSGRGLRTVRWEGRQGHAVQLVVDPNMGHGWPMEWATRTIAEFFEAAPART